MKYLLLALLLILASCAVPLTDEGSKVREIEPAWANQCEFIQTGEIINRQGYDPKSCGYNAKLKMRNHVASVGGNAYLIVAENFDLCLVGGARVSYEIYKCPDLQKH